MIAPVGLEMPHARGVRSPYEETGATVAAFARPVRLRPVDRRSTPCLSPIAPRTSSLAMQTQRRRLRRTRPERSAWPEPEPTSSGPWQPREPMLPDDRDFGPAMARLTQRQRIFVDGLFCGLKQTAAAHRAGYSNRGHADAVVGHRLGQRLVVHRWKWDGRRSMARQRQQCRIEPALLARVGPTRL